MLLYNATNEEQSVKAFGNWFNFKPKQIKEISDDIGRFIMIEKKHYGIVGLPDEMADLDYRQSEEGKAVLADRTREGVNNFVSELRKIVHNAEVGLRQDLEKSGLKSDYRAHMSKGEIDALRKLAAYQKDEEDVTKLQIDEIKELEKKLKR